MKLIVDEEVQGCNMECLAVQDAIERINDILDENVVEVRIIKRATCDGGSGSSRDSVLNSQNCK